jgi:hypothetical protein
MLHGPELLQEFMTQYNNYLFISKWMKQMFVYLDRYYLKFGNQTGIELTAFNIFKEQVSNVMKGDLVGALLEEIRKWR